MLEGVICRFPNPHRKPRSQVWTAGVLKAVILRFWNPYRKPRHQVTDNRHSARVDLILSYLGIRSGRVGCLRE